MNLISGTGNPLPFLLFLDPKLRAVKSRVLRADLSVGLDQKCRKFLWNVWQLFNCFFRSELHAVASTCFSYTKTHHLHAAERVTQLGNSVLQWKQENLRILEQRERSIAQRSNYQPNYSDLYFDVRVFDVAPSIHSTSFKEKGPFFQLRWFQIKSLW